MGEKRVPGERMSAREAIEAEADFQRQDLLRRTGKAPTQEQMVNQLRHDVIRHEKIKERR